MKYNMGVFSSNKRKQYDVCIVHLADARFYPFFHRQALALAEQNLRVALVSWENKKGEGDPRWPGIDVFPIYIPGSVIQGKWFFARYMFACLFVLCRTRSKLYLAVDPPTLFPSRIAAFFNKSRYSYFSLEYFQGIEQIVGKPAIRTIWYLLERIGLARAKSIAAVCQTTESFLKQEYRISKTFTILNVPESSEYACQSKNILRTTLNLDPKAPLAVYKGKFMENRGLMPFIKAMSPFRELHFACIGNGEMQPAMSALARELDCEERVHFLDQIPSADFVHYLKDADLGHVIHENKGVNMMVTLPSKLFDYIHAGIPVIASDGPEISRIVRTWNIGWLVSPSSIESIQKALASFLQTLGNQSLIKNNCAKAAKQFCWEKEKKQYVEFIKESLCG